MPYADPEKRQAAAKIRAAKSRLNRKMAKLQGRFDDGGGVAGVEGLGAIPVPGADAPKNGKAVKGKTTLPQNLPQEPQGDVPNLQDWARRKVRVGLSWVNKAEEMLDRNPVSAFQLGRAGVDLVNANLALLQAEASGPDPGSMAVVDKRFLLDPEYLDLAEKMLSRKAVLQRTIDLSEPE